jgi:hypothetical protein
MVPGLFMPNENALGMLTLLSFPAGSLAANAFSGDAKNIGQLLFFWFLIIMIAAVGWGWRNGSF